MLSPPNHGSEVVDKLRRWPLFPLDQRSQRACNWEQSQMVWFLVLGRRRLRLASLQEIGASTGFLSRFIPGPDDGKVSIESARLEGMRDFLVVHCFAPLHHEETGGPEIDHVRFLESGSFQESP